jgi:hypothetical protein
MVIEIDKTFTTDEVEKFKGEWNRMLQSPISKSEIKILPSKHKIKILCLSIWYPLSMSRYFEDALKCNPNVDLLTCGIYTGAFIPWMGGMELPMKYAKPIDIPLPFRPDIGKVDYDLVRANLPAGWIPDIVLCIDAGISWKHKPNQGKVIHVATDPHALNYDHQRTLSDLFFNMQYSYMKDDDIYLPYAYNPRVHYPLESKVEHASAGVVGHYYIKDTDAVLIGMPYEHRVQWVEALRVKGVSVIFENGPVFDEYRELNNRARIGLNWSSLNDLNARAYELPAMKLAPVMNKVSDLERSGIECASFTTLPEAVENVLYLKENDKARIELAEAAYKSVLGETYDSRLEVILKMAGFI